MTDLEELQNGWSILNEELDNQEVVNKEAIKNNIEKLRSQISTSHQQIIHRSSLSIWIGIIFIILAVSVIAYLCLFKSSALSAETIKSNIYWIFALPIVCITMFWDYWTKKQLKTLNPIDSTVIDMIKKTNKLLKYAVYEIYFVFFIFVTGSILIYIYEGFYRKPILHQSILISVYCLFAIAATIYIRKYILSPLKQIKDNAKDLQSM